MAARRTSTRPPPSRGDRAPGEAARPLPASPASGLEQDLLALVESMRERVQQDPFGNPVLAAALAISRRMQDGELGEDAVAELIRTLRDAAFEARAARLAAYVGGVDPAATKDAYASLARKLIRPDPSD